MQHLFRRFIGGGAVVATLGLGILLAGCTSASNSDNASNTTPPAAVNVPTVPNTAPPTANPPVPAGDNADTEQEALAYLQSPDRVSQYQNLVPKAGVVIAKALESGKFGPTKKYNDLKTDLKPGYVGWGGISSMDNAQFAWVYWNNGKIDFSKPITQIAINNTDKLSSAQILIFGPQDAKDFWTVFSYIDDNTVEVGDTTGFALKGYTPSVDPTQKVRYISPTTVADLQYQDRIAIATIDDNMVSWFGSSWNK